VHMDSCQWFIHARLESLFSCTRDPWTWIIFVRLDLRKAGDLGKEYGSRALGERRVARKMITGVLLDRGRTKGRVIQNVNS
jgi:hypothetical protein